MKKQTKKQVLQTSLNEMDDIKAHDMRNLMNFNFPIRCKFMNKKQKEMSDTIKQNRITFVSGPPGTGKTLIALKTALDLLKDDNVPIDSIKLTTPIVNVGHDIGYLPGGLDDKISNYFGHFYSNLDKLVGKDVTIFLTKSGVVSQKIINFMRGDTFGRYDEKGNPIGEYCILDEGQNMTKMEVKTYISRLGENSKIVILFDPEQSDVKWDSKTTNGAIDAVTRLGGLDGVGYVEFTDDEIVRDSFLREIMKRYRD